MSAAQAKFEITADDKTAAAWNSALHQGKEFGEKLKEVTLGFAGFAGLTIGAEKFGESLHEAVKRGDELARLADRMGTTTEFLSQMQYAAKQVDLEFATFTSGLDTMSKNLGMAAEETGRAQQALKDLKIDAKELIKLPIKEQVNRIADAIAGLRNPTDQTRIAMQLIGGTGADLLPILRNGAEGIRKFGEESDKFGHTMSGTSATALREVDDLTKQLTARVEGFFNKLAAGYAFLARDMGLLPSKDPALDALGKQYADVAEKLTGLYKSRKLFTDGPFSIFGEASTKEADKYLASINKLEGELDVIRQKEDALIKSRKDQEGAKPEKRDLYDMVGLQARIDAQEKLNQKQGEFNIAADKARNEQLQEWEKYYQELDTLTQTDDEKKVESLDKQLSATETLLAKNLITYEQYVKRREEILDKELPDVIVRSDKIVEKVKSSHFDMSQIVQRGTQSMQQSFSDYLFDPAAEGFGGMAKGFANAIKRMLADAASAKLFEALFGDGKFKSGGDNGAAGGWLSSLLGAFGGSSSGDSGATGDALGAYYAGARADGGSVDAGSLYRVNERGMEYFKPNTGGTIIPLGAGGGGGNITIHNNVTVGSNSSVSRAEIAAAMQQTSQATIAQMQDMKRRGKF